MFGKQTPGWSKPNHHTMLARPHQINVSTSARKKYLRGWIIIFPPRKKYGMGKNAWQSKEMVTGWGKHPCVKKPGYK